VRPEALADKMPSNYAGVTGASRRLTDVVKGMSLEKDLCGNVFIDGFFVPEDKYKGLPLAPTSARKFPDGTSKTLAVGERTYIWENWMEGLTYQASGNAPPTEVCSYSAKNIAFPNNSNVANIGYFVSDTEAPTGSSFNVLQNDLFFGSSHPGITQFCFADGSVHAIADSILFQTLQALATRDGSEVSDWSD
jgi:hypothetical protein